MNASDSSTPKLAVIDIASDAPIAALDGETPELILLEIGRHKIESSDTRVILTRLRQLTADRDTVMSSKGALCVMVAGYDNDPRALPQIAEYCVYMSALISAWPYFGWFCALSIDYPQEVMQSIEAASRPDSLLMNILLANACSPVDPPSVRGHAPHNGWTPVELIRDRMAANVERLFNGLIELGERHTIPMTSVQERITAIEQLLEDRGII
jgi:hypothetical protein